MPTLKEIFAAGTQKPNRAKTAAEITKAGIENAPEDAFGFGALSKIPLMTIYGAQRGQAQNIEEQNTQALQDLINKKATTEEEKTAFKNKFDIMTKAFDFHSKGDTGSAVGLLNQFKKELDISEGVDVSGIIGEPGKGGGQIELKKKKDGSTMIIDMGKGGVNVWNPKTQKYEAATQEQLDTITSGKAGSKKVGSTKERILSKIADKGYDLLSEPEKEAWDLLDDSDKTIAQEVLKTLRVSDEYKALNDDNDPGGTRRDDMIKGMTETVRSLFERQEEQDINVDQPFTEPGTSGEIDVVRGIYPDTPQLDQGFQGAGGQGGAPATGAGNIPTPGAADLNQAKRAPDGLLYVPDPNRPGKYLRVEE